MLFEDRTFRCTRRGYKLKKFQEINSKYVKIPNELVDDRNLSWKAKGLFCHMASKPDSYNFTVSHHYQVSFQMVGFALFQL